ncbi:aromatic prenyltransferase [Stipitochalara longipes BDJ]|nr:aromatic prenyltransferase [Stipitochalara longipes BDJ]
MSSSPSPESLKRNQVTITTTELPGTEHHLPNDTTKTIISRELAIFQELLSSKTLESEVLEKGNNQALIEERQVCQDDDRRNQARFPTVKLILTQDINPTGRMFNVEPFTPSTRGLCFANISQAFWYRTTTPLLSKLLGIAKYPPHLQDQYTFFYNNSVLPGLGPVPSPANKWTPHLTHNGSPFEPSLAFQNNKQQVRFTFEPIGPLAGTLTDRFNQSLPLAFVSSLASSNTCPNLNLEWWYHFTTAFFVSETELAAHPSPFVGVKVQPTCYLAFDLPGEEFAPVLKPYLFPHRRALLQGMDKANLVFEAIRHIPSSVVDMSPALEKVETFLSQHQENSIAQLALQAGRDGSGKASKAKALSVEMLSFDCASSSESRLKIYAKTHDTSFANVRDIFTLGGQLRNSSTLDGLEALERFWKQLLLLREDWNDHESQSAEFLHFKFEFSPGKLEPDIKIYVPSWTLGINKTGLTRGLGRYFRELGWDVGNTYRNDMQQVFGGIDEPGRVGYTYTSFTYGENGPAVAMYCTPKFASPL